MTPFLAPILTKLFNKSIEEHTYPDALKLTKVIEVYKAKDKTLPENYRPISLLPIIAKLLDTIINAQVMTHLTKYNIISPTQYAFRPNSSTTVALQTVTDRIHKSTRNSQPTLAIYVDLSKAYDTISHAKLLHKLEHEFNFEATTVKFFESYFANRTQSTHTQHAQSKIQIITHGIPQGSTLSTTLFLLYINDIRHTVPDSTVYTYADDTTLIVISENIQSTAQSELNNLIKYFHGNNLVPNPTKTTYTVFYPHDAHENIQLQVNGKPITQTDQAKLLGLYIQNDKKHHRTVANTITKLWPTIRSFKYANKLLPTHVMKQLYYSQVYPHLIYALPVWGTDKPNSAYIQPLIRIQKKILRLVKNVPPRTHTKPIMKELEILNVPNLYTLRVCAEMHPFMYPKRPLNRPEHNHTYMPTAQLHEHATRQATAGKLYTPNMNTKKAKQTAHHTTQKYTDIWNKLPENIRTINNIKKFKKTLKKYMLDRQ